MTRIYFVRHAEPNYSNHDNALRELSAKGMADRALVTDYLRDKGIAAVLSSPYKRAVDTVAPLADALGLPVETVDGFRERQISGAWIQDFDAYSRRQWADFSYKRSGGESLGEVERRNIAALDGVLARFPEQAVAVGSHGTALATILHHFRPRFGYNGFQRLRSLMPWIVRLDFAGAECAGIEAYNVFTGRTRAL